MIESSSPNGKATLPQPYDHDKPLLKSSNTSGMLAKDVEVLSMDEGILLKGKGVLQRMSQLADLSGRDMSNLNTDLTVPGANSQASSLEWSNSEAARIRSMYVRQVFLHQRKG